MNVIAALWRIVALVSLCSAVFIVGLQAHAPAGVSAGRVTALLLIAVGLIGASRGFSLVRHVPIAGDGAELTLAKKAMLSTVSVIAAICMGASSWLASQESSGEKVAVLAILAILSAVVLELCVRRMLHDDTTA